MRSVMPDEKKSDRDLFNPMPGVERGRRGLSPEGPASTPMPFNTDPVPPARDWPEPKRREGMPTYDPYGTMPINEDDK
jgi:hypothetical protein